MAEVVHRFWKPEWQIQPRQEFIIFHLVLNTILCFKNNKLWCC